jgi:hypothetical protein
MKPIICKGELIMTSVDQAFHELIKNCWKCMKAYNQQGKESAIHALSSLREGIDTLIHHLQNSE